jgi:hypothetical protein
LFACLFILFVCFVDWSVSRWLVAWLAGLLVGWLVGWLVVLLFD